MDNCNSSGIRELAEGIRITTCVKTGFGYLGIQIQINTTMMDHDARDFVADLI